jgi:hypothetical protein
MLLTALLDVEIHNAAFSFQHTFILCMSRVELMHGLKMGQNKALVLILLKVDMYCKKGTICNCNIKREKESTSNASQNFIGLV